MSKNNILKHVGRIGIVSVVMLMFVFSGIIVIDSAFGYSFIVVTNHGVEFPIESPTTDNDSSENTSDGKSMIDGMGIQSRIIQKDYDGYI